MKYSVIVIHKIGYCYRVCLEYWYFEQQHGMNDFVLKTKFMLRNFDTKILTLIFTFTLI